jgi:hypothetical protein
MSDSLNELHEEEHRVSPFLSAPFNHSRFNNLTSSTGRPDQIRINPTKSDQKSFLRHDHGPLMKTKPSLGEREERGKGDGEKGSRFAFFTKRTHRSERSSKFQVQKFQVIRKLQNEAIAWRAGSIRNEPTGRCGPKIHPRIREIRD